MSARLKLNSAAGTVEKLEMGNQGAFVKIKNTSLGSKLVLTKCHVIRIGNVTHLSFSSAHVRCRDINSRTNEILLCQFNGKSSCNLLKFSTL